MSAETWTPAEQVMIDWIDNATYQGLLQRWRYAACGDPFFMGRVGDYYCRAMKDRQAALPKGEHTAASKAIG